MTRGGGCRDVWGNWRNGPSCCLMSGSLGMQGRLSSLWSDGSAGVVRSNLNGAGREVLRTEV